MTDFESVPPPLEGIEEWTRVVDAAFHGLHHALNNRIGSLSALVELFQMELPTDGSGFRTLSDEVARLTDPNRVIHLLRRDPSPGEEPLILDDVLADVLAIHRYLHDVRELEVTIVPTRYVEPVRVERWALVHVLTMLLADAKRLAKDTDSPVRAVMESDEQWVRVEFRVGNPTVDASPTGGRYPDLLAESFGGKVERRAGVAELGLPTLKARRAAARR